MTTPADDALDAAHVWNAACPADLLIEVDFKWLMAGQGNWIDPVRLHADPQYAHHCLQAAINSPCDALRQCAHHLQTALGAA